MFVNVENFNISKESKGAYLWAAFAYNNLTNIEVINALAYCFIILIYMLKRFLEQIKIRYEEVLVNFL